jgi:protein-S-isoprenylcysteine O-methyltransferase Ste14
LRDNVKIAFKEIFGEDVTRAFYRFAYTIISMLTFGVAILLIRSLPDREIYSGPLWLRLVFHAIQAIGLIFGLLTFRTLDIWEFIGLRQLLNFLKYRKTEGNIEGIKINRLIKDGTYGIVRHPLYLAGIIIFTFNPIFTENWLTVSILADLYFIYGIFAEEKRLEKVFGTEYREYKKQVPAIIPRIGFLGFKR